MNAIEIKHLTKHQSPYFSLKCPAMALPSGCIMGLVGKNGAGKSTLIRLILGMIRKDSGEITLLGESDPTAHKEVFEQIGVVQDTASGIPGVMNAVQVGKLMRGIYRHWDAAVYDGYLSRFDIPRKARFDHLSRGTRVKLNLAIALSHGAKLLILDEATNGLDPLMRDEIIDILMDFTRCEEHSVLIASHMIGDLEKICDYVAHLRGGEVLYCEEKDRLLERYAIVRVSAEELSHITPAAILGKRETPFCVDAVIHRDAIPREWTIAPITLEELFIMMEKEEQRS